MLVLTLFGYYLLVLKLFSSNKTEDSLFLTEQDTISKFSALQNVELRFSWHEESAFPFLLPSSDTLHAVCFVSTEVVAVNIDESGLQTSVVVVTIDE